MQLKSLISVLALATAITAAPAPEPHNEAPEGPYLKVREPGCGKRSPSPSCGYTYIKKSEISQLISRDANDAEESYLQVREPGCIKRDTSCAYTYIKRTEIPGLAERDESAEESYLKVREPGCIKRDTSCAYVQFGPPSISLSSRSSIGSQ